MPQKPASVAYISYEKNNPDVSHENTGTVYS